MVTHLITPHSMRAGCHHASMPCPNHPPSPSITLQSMNHEYSPLFSAAAGCSSCVSDRTHRRYHLSPWSTTAQQWRDRRVYMYAACGMREYMVPSPHTHSLVRHTLGFHTSRLVGVGARAGALAAALLSARHSNGTAPWTASSGRRAVRSARRAAFHSLCREQMLCQSVIRVLFCRESAQWHGIQGSARSPGGQRSSRGMVYESYEQWAGSRACVSSAQSARCAILRNVCRKSADLAGPGGSSARDSPANRWSGVDGRPMRGDPDGQRRSSQRHGDPTGV